MKIKLFYLRLIVICLFISDISAQSISRNVIASCGGFASASNGSLSWTMGETFQQTLQAGNAILTQGFQQIEADTVTLDLSLFIQGFYLGSGVLRATVDPLGFPFLSDTISVDLADAEIPHSILYTSKITLDTAGFASVRFPGIVQGHPYYVVVHHRNALETWSGTPLSLALPKAVYDFSISASSAYGDNLSDLGDGRFALWSGDLNQDGQIDVLDQDEFEVMLPLLLNGYYPSDLNGDGISESADFSLLENNFSLLITRAKP